MSIQTRTANQSPLKSTSIFDSAKAQIYFNPDIKSTNIPTMKFTNFIDSKKSPIVNTLKNERRKIINGEVDYANEYEPKGITYKSSEKRKIDKIMLDTLGFKLNGNDYQYLIRLKYLFNAQIQYYILDKLDGTYEVLFIDIYHLVIPARDKSHHELVANPSKTYDEHKNANYCLSNIYGNHK